MEQGYLRTTIRMPVETHEQLMYQAFNEKKSFNQVMLEWLPGKKATSTRLERFLVGEKKLEAIRKKYGKQSKRIDTVQAIRDLREGKFRVV